MSVEIYSSGDQYDEEYEHNTEIADALGGIAVDQTVSVAEPIDEIVDIFAVAKDEEEKVSTIDSVRIYLNQIGKVALLNAEDEVVLSKRIEAGLYSRDTCKQG